MQLSGVRIFSAGLLALILTACGQPPTPETALRTDRQTFISNLRALCGQSFAGHLVSTDDADADFRDLSMVMHVRDCGDDIIRIPFHVGDDRSRTWVITSLGDGLRLEHDHRHEDGTSDALTLYGGQTEAGNAGLKVNDERAQNFPADDKTKALFIRENIEVSTQNTWRVEVQPGNVFAYQMSRPGRMFRVEFDLTKPVATPPPAWGYEGQ